MDASYLYLRLNMNIASGYVLTIVETY